jgi:hypothetical protein
MDDPMTSPATRRVAVVGMRGGSPYRATVETLRGALSLVRDEVVDAGLWAATGGVEVDGRVVMDADEVWERASWGCRHDLPAEPEEWARRAGAPRSATDRSECRGCIGRAT